jgi:hypothetical protein
LSKDNEERDDANEIEEADAVVPERERWERCSADGGDNEPEGWASVGVGGSPVVGGGRGSMRTPCVDVSIVWVEAGDALPCEGIATWYSSTVCPDADPGGLELKDRCDGNDNDDGEVWTDEDVDGRRICV